MGHQHHKEKLQCFLLGEYLVTVVTKVAPLLFKESKKKGCWGEWWKEKPLMARHAGSIIPSVPVEQRKGEHQYPPQIRKEHLGVVCYLV